MDPHTMNLAKNVSNKVYRLPSFSKLSYLVKGLDRNEVIPILGFASSFPIYKLPLPHFVSFFFIIFEYIIWMLINKIWTLPKIILPKNGDGDDIIIYINSIHHQQHIKLLKKLDKRGFRFIFYMSHIHVDVEYKLNLLTMFPTSKCFSESMPLKNSLSTPLIDENKYFFVPYSVPNRFLLTNTNDIGKVSSKILVTGTVVLDHGKCKDSFIGIFGSKYLHPLRVELFKKKDNIVRYFNNVAAEYSVLGNNYFKRDMPMEYKSHEFFICPEDITGMPSTNMLEGMSCGCIYFGNQNMKYFDLYGMKPWEHFIPHNGSINGIIESYEFVINNKETLRKIKQNGKDLAQKYTDSYVYSFIQKELQSLKTG
jgi:hypothetical protein